MATVTMMQGDSYNIPVSLKLNGNVLTPQDVSEIEICIGENLRKTLSGGTVGYDETTQEWFFRPTQEETLALTANESYQIIARVKFQNGKWSDVIGIPIGQLNISDSISEEVI